jgi:hypothetical protein
VTLKVASANTSMDSSSLELVASSMWLDFRLAAMPGMKGAGMPRPARIGLIRVGEL